jgi:hypothetical protein
MSGESEREILKQEDLKLPDCPLPRPGEEVVWYTDAVKRTGVYLGYGPGSKPIVDSKLGFNDRLNNFAGLRLLHPEKRVGPIWSNLPEGTIRRPHEAETAKFMTLLLRVIPPGLRYMELIHEIWYRGFEVFLVGGTVRDVIAGGEPKDVDLVTTMPLTLALPFLKNMFRNEPSIDYKNGFVRLGGTPRSGDSFIDLKSFVYKEPGTNQAVFAGDFQMDVKHRDFACNSVYYDPVNNALFDPRECGIRTAEEKTLEIVCDWTLRGPYHRATIVIRFCKFVTRGFKFTDQTATELHTYFLTDLNAMEASRIVDYVNTQLFSKSPPGARADLLAALKQAFIDLRAESIWRARIEPALKAAGVIEE